MRKNRMMRLASVLLICVLLTTSVISGTFAKYTSTASGSDTARVAKWSIDVEGTEIAVSGTPAAITFDLFNTISDVGGSADDEQVKDDLLAPGTSGAFTLNIKNLSEVDAKYTITLAETNDSNIPLQYSLSGADGSWKNSVAELEMNDLTDVTIVKETGTGEHIVYWRWAFDDNTADRHAGQKDETDTKLGIAARIEGGEPFVTITATITATQVD